MDSRQQRYALIADELRKQAIPEEPFKHEWLELITQLSLDDDPVRRKIGVNELSKSAENAPCKRTR
jgi:hypothetical protein